MNADERDAKYFHDGWIAALREVRLRSDRQIGEFLIEQLDHPAGGVSPTAPDDRQAAWDAWSEALTDLNREEPSYYEAFTAGYDAGFRRSREATTEPQPITDADVEAAARAIAAVDLPHWTWEQNEASGVSAEYRNMARAALEVVEASRSPKPTEQEIRSTDDA